MNRRIPAPAPARRPSTRRVSTVLAGVALALATTGCSVNSPVQTNVAYLPADGVQADVGHLAVRDLVLVGDGTGTVVVSGSATNLGEQDMTVQIAAQPDPNATTPPSGSEVQLRPHEQVNLATKGLQLSAVTTKPGGLQPLVVEHRRHRRRQGSGADPEDVLLHGHPGAHRQLTPRYAAMTGPPAGRAGHRSFVCAGADDVCRGRASRRRRRRHPAQPASNL